MEDSGSSPSGVTGEPVDISGLSFTATYDDESTGSVIPSSYTPTSFGDTVGTQTVTFSFEGTDITVDVDYDVAAPVLVSISISGIPQTPTEFGPVNTTGLTVTATYDNDTTKDVTSQAVFTDYETGTGNVGSVWKFEGDDYGTNETRVVASYTEGGETKTANSAKVAIAPTANGPNTAATAYELENTANNYVTLDWRGYDNVNVQTMDPFKGDPSDPHGYLVEGAERGQLVWMSFTKAQYDGDTPVDLATFYGLVGLTGAKTDPDVNGPCWWDGCSVGSQSWQACNAVDGTATITDPVHIVTMIGYLNDDIAAGGEGTIKKSMIVPETKKEFWVDVVAPTNP